MKPSLTVEIHGTGTRNRGAELMCLAIVQKLRATVPEARIVVSPEYGDFASRARRNLLAIAEFAEGPAAAPLNFLLRASRPEVRSVLGVVRPAEIDIVLDASGFILSDQWGSGAAKYLYRKVTRHRRRGIPVVLLPQAFGPFEIKKVARRTRKLCERASLVFARDPRSKAFLEKLGVAADRLRLCPDFTIGVPPRKPDAVRLPNEFVAVVPNYRMIDKGESESDYLEFLTNLIGFLRENGETPIFVLHDSEDVKVVRALADRGVTLSAVEEDDPQALKWVLSQAKFSVASRYHAIVSTLSLGVPCLGAGWSHKYEALFEDFGCPELLLRDLRDRHATRKLVTMLAAPESRQATRDKIETALRAIRRANEKMWEEVMGLVKRCAAVAP